ncbi:Kelch repeat-containing protein [Haloferula chungangensis]|uniref:Kelch repeat-containing protein n=1 Tax=Haloferula chungangensis TaxID=1048331 RepID=A0ABW2L9R2_9BACT
MKLGYCLIPSLGLALAAFAQMSHLEGSKWEQVKGEGNPCKRHEHAFVEVDDQFIALGGRRIQAVDLYNPETSTWSTGKQPPVELHHFQALSHDGKVLVAGAFTGKYPRETPVSHLYFYDPSADAWSKGPEIPEERRRGSAGAFIKDDKLYLVCGLTDGHRSGWVPWFDEYDFSTKTWTRLPDAPRGRDHFQAVLIDEQLILAGGRRSGEGGSVFAPVIKEVDVFDFKSNTWKTLDQPIPTPRAGTSSLALGNESLVIGGESARKEAHIEVDALDPKTGNWRSLPALPGGRHATQPILYKGRIYLQAGSVTRGGTETNTMLRIPTRDLVAGNRTED